MSCDCGNSSIGRWTGKVGGQLGDRLDSLGRGAVASGLKRFKNWTGLGDYRINSNSLIEMGGESAFKITTRGRSTVISFREYIGEVSTGPDIGEFHATQYAVNPADPFTFPWLSPIASQFDQYIPKGIIFEFKSTATDLTTATSLGSVLMASEYDVTDPPYANKQQMLNSAYSQEAKMSEDAMHGIECLPSETQRKLFYTRSAGTPLGLGTDLRDYDLCTFTVATQGGGLTANTSVGSLYVHYEFELLKEQLYGGLQMKAVPAAIYSNQTLTWANAVNAEMKLIAGTEFGLLFPSAGWMSFPAKWAGATFKIETVYSQNIPFNWTSTFIDEVSGQVINSGMVPLKDGTAASAFHADQETLAGRTDGVNHSTYRQAGLAMATYQTTSYWKVNDQVSTDIVFFANPAPRCNINESVQAPLEERYFTVYVTIIDPSKLIPLEGNAFLTP